MKTAALIFGILIVSTGAFSQTTAITEERLERLYIAIEKEGLKKTWYTKDQALTQPLQIVKRIASDLSRGRVLPDQFADDVRIEVKKIDLTQALNQFISADIEADQFVAAVKPKNKIYQQAVSALLKLQQTKQDAKWISRPAQLKLAPLEKGSSNRSLVLYLRAKLNEMGYKNSAIVPEFDSELVELVKVFQLDHNLDTDGVVGKTSWTYLERGIDQLITQAIINIDRTRWLPQQDAADLIYVNLAGQNLTFYKDNKVIQYFKTINGRLDRKTPLLVDAVKNVVINPTWTVPFSIFVKDKLPELRKDPGFLAKNRMKIIDDTTRLEVDPYTIDWNQNLETIKKYTIIQAPGPWNALGFIKFPLQNPYAIYLHDTSDRSKFAANPRLFSSGCVRLSSPFEFAENLLESSKWTVESLKEATEKSLKQATVESWLRTKKTFPVYISYKTLEVKEDGRIISLNDVYGLDQVGYAKMVGTK